MKIQCRECWRDFGDRNVTQGQAALVLRCCDTVQVLGAEAGAYHGAESDGSVVVTCRRCGQVVCEAETAPTLLLDPPDCAHCGGES